MKWSFIVGGIVGITAAAYLTQKRPQALSWVTNAAGNVWGGVMDRSVNKIFKMPKFTEIGANANAVSNTASTSVDSTQQSKQAWERIDELMHNDPQAREEAQRILSQNLMTNPH